jgi:DNA polymerase
MSAAEFVPDSRSLAILREAAQGCKGCSLYQRATQTVFGAGTKKAKLILLGEQPGDQEDLEGEPFVGPAGRLLDEVLENAQIDRKLVYVTNAVKHFKWEPRGKRRLHSKPSAREIAACRPWFEAELAAIEPKVVVCLGATAAQSVLGRDFRLTKRRGELLADERGFQVVATYHPSAILRAPDHHARAEMRGWMVADLKVAAEAADGG